MKRNSMLEIEPTGHSSFPLEVAEAGWGRILDDYLADV